MFGNMLQGNDCRWLLAQAEGIVDGMYETVISSPSKNVSIPNDHIKKVCYFHKLYFFALDGYISCILTKRFHLTREVLELTKNIKINAVKLNVTYRFPSHQKVM